MLQIAQCLNPLEVGYLKRIGHLRQPIHDSGNIDASLARIQACFASGMDQAIDRGRDLFGRVTDMREVKPRAGYGVQLFWCDT